MPNTVTVRLFAGLAELAGVRQTTVDLGEGLTARDVYAVLARRHPKIAGFGGSVMFARNQEYVPAETPLAPGDELALIPPVSGGSSNTSVGATFRSPAGRRAGAHDV
jgi:molybdopterin converting factor subunit 1